MTEEFVGIPFTLFSSNWRHFGSPLQETTLVFVLIWGGITFMTPI